MAKASFKLKSVLQAQQELPLKKQLYVSLKALKKYYSKSSDTAVAMSMLTRQDADLHSNKFLQHLLCGMFT